MKKGKEKEEYVDCAARENCSSAGRQFGNAWTEGSFGAGMVNVSVNMDSSCSRMVSVNNPMRLLAE